MRKAVIISSLILGLVAFFGLLIIVYSLSLGYLFASRFSQAAHEPLLTLSQRFVTYRQLAKNQIGQNQTYLLLGLDSLQTRGDEPPMTDTIMLLSFWPKDGIIATVSLPRDLYLDSSKAKINALYADHLQNPAVANSNLAKTLVAKDITDLTQVKIDHTVIFTLDDMAALVDATDGLNVNVETAFKDELFPRPDVDVTKVRDPKLLYKTVEFQSGAQIMNGQRVLEYVRSRHSPGSEGNDLARNKRQQQVMVALIGKLTDLQNLKSPETLGRLYRLYHTRFEAQLPPTRLIPIALSYARFGQVPRIKKLTLSIYPDDKNGVIYHPPEWQYRGAWVFAIKDLTQFQSEIRTNLMP